MQEKWKRTVECKFADGRFALGEMGFSSGAEKKSFSV